MNAEEWKTRSRRRRRTAEEKAARKDKVYERRWNRVGSYRVYLTANEVCSFLKTRPSVAGFTNQFEEFRALRQRLRIDKGQNAKDAWANALVPFLPVLRDKWPQYVLDVDTDAKLEVAVLEHHKKALDNLVDDMEAPLRWANASKAVLGRECSFTKAVEWVASMLLRPLSDIPLNDAPSPSALGLLRYAMANETTFWEKFYAKIAPASRSQGSSGSDEGDRSDDVVKRAIEELNQ